MEIYAMAEYDIYKGFRLRLRLDESPHGIECPELDLFDETLAGMKSKINVHLKANKAEKAPAIPVLSVSGDATFECVTLTSLAESGDAWVVNNGRRYKCSRGYLYADTPENKAALIDLQAKMDAAKSELHKLRGLIKNLSKPDILKEPVP